MLARAMDISANDNPPARPPPATYQVAKAQDGMLLPLAKASHVESPKEELHPRGGPGQAVDADRGEGLVPVIPSAMVGVGGLQSFEKYNVSYLDIIVYLFKLPARIPTWSPCTH